MDAGQRIERALTAELLRAEAPNCPTGLAAAVRYAVFPGGARIRPRLCIAVAEACGEDDPGLSDAAASAIELLHCASLVHDDLPCFDDASTRRGRPSVHRAFGEQLAVLSGDALIVLAFQMIARGAARHPERLSELLLVLARGVGMPAGIVAGQAWESEPQVVLSDYQQAKTGALFAASTVAGAASAGAPAAGWRTLGERLGEAYQVADDLRDVAADPETLGKPVGRDAVLGRPSAVAQFGVTGAMQRLKALVEEAIASIPDCPGIERLQGQIVAQAKSFLPKELARRAA
jgi:geranylgeranyl diphosphate synthase type II